MEYRTFYIVKDKNNILLDISIDQVQAEQYAEMYTDSVISVVTVLTYEESQ